MPQLLPLRHGEELPLYINKTSSESSSLLRVCFTREK